MSPRSDRRYETDTRQAPPAQFLSARIFFRFKTQKPMPILSQGVAMTDGHYRWQDHLAPTVGWKADLIIGVVFAALLPVADVHHVQHEHEIRQQRPFFV